MSLNNLFLSLRRLVLPGGLVAFSLVTALPSQALAQKEAQSDREVVAAAISALSSPSSMKVEFEQVLTNPLTGNSYRSSGFMFRMPGERFAIRFAPPSSDRVVCDGQVVWLYMPSSVPGQVMRLPQESGACAMADPLKTVLSPQMMSQLEVVSHGSDTLSGKAVRVFKLAWSSPAIYPITSLRLWISPGARALRQVEIVQAGGMIQTIRLVSVSPGAKVPASEFDFTPPKGSRVVSGPGL